MAEWNKYNPFAKRESHGGTSITTYKVFTFLTWLLSIVATCWYTFHAPRDGHHARKTIWQQNSSYDTAFSLNSTITSIYWIILWIMQGGYIGHLFSSNADRVNAASDVGSHFILSNLFHFAFIMLFVRSHFGWAELMLILNWFNLTSLYYRYNTYARFIHAPVVSGPLAWTFVAIFWNGALMVPHPTTLVARIFGNIFIWVIFLYGMFYLSVYKDYTMGLSLSVLMASLGVHQFLSKVIALQWIFAFVIMAVLFVATMSIAVPVWNGKEIKFRRTQPDEERAPLLNEGTTS